VSNPELSPWLAIAAGHVNGISSVFKFGLNEAVGTTEEDIWIAGGSASYLGSAEQMDIVSDSASDDDGSSGALTVSLSGLDANYDLLDETVTLNGTGAVGTANDYLRLYRMAVVTAGSLGNAGLITATACNANSLQAQISAGSGQSLQALYTVPRNHTAYVAGIKVSVPKTKDVQAKMYTKLAGGAWNIRWHGELFETNIQEFFRAMWTIEAKSDIAMRAVADVTARVAGSFCLILSKDT
jgi:hypothetical protein